MQGLTTSSPEPSSIISRWKHRILKINPLRTEALYGYKERETPTGFKPDPRRKAFHIKYDRDSSSLQLQPLCDNNCCDVDAESIDFKDTRRHFKNNPREKIYGWRLTDNDRSKNAWESCKMFLLDQGQYELNRYNPGDQSKDQTRSRAFISGPQPLWALRGFFIGPNTDCSPPYFTILCSGENESKYLVDVIDKEIRGKGLRDWGVTRLPYVEICEYGSRSGSPENVDDAESTSEMNEVEVQIIDGGLSSTIPNDAMASSWRNRRHRCGVRFQVTSDSNVIANGTIGGLLKVGGRLYGLTVAHVFHRSGQSQQNYSTSSFDDESSTSVQNQWHEQRKESMLLDRALVELPGLEKPDDDPDTWDDVNLVRTMNGDFRPVWTTMEMPRSGVYAVLATPGSTHCLRGIITGEEAIVNMPGSPAPYTTWVLQMEQPWLIQAGDSGSWALDAITGDLLGVLIAGCPELHEAYIIPAYQILGDIEKDLGRQVRLPHCHRTQKQNQHTLTDLERSVLEIQKKIVQVNSAAEMKNIEGLADDWIEKSRRMPDNEPKMSFQPRNKESYWINRYGGRIQHDILELMSTIRESEGVDYLSRRAHLIWPYQDALSRPPLECYNSLSKMFRDLGQEKIVEYKIDLRILRGILWGHLVLGEQIFRPYINPISTAGHNAFWVLEEERKAIDDPDCPRQKGLKFPRDRYYAEEVVDMLRQNMEYLISNEKWLYSVSLPETVSFDPGLSDNITLFVAVLLSEQKDQVLVVAQPADCSPEDCKIEDIRLPYVQIDKGTDEEGNLKILLKDLIGLGDAIPLQTQRLELKRMSPSIWLKEHKQYVDLVVMEAILLQNDLERARTGSWEMPVVVMGNDDAWRKLIEPFSSIFYESSALFN
ncbi:Ff.00g062320.m01.CDS01 [Fusarium sp. VM40]|nr:Ff.00g062320.m01.CDS01 [Fusarium sp. VM40]